MTILYFGIYDPEYSRNRILIKGLRENGVRVIECSDRSRSFLKYIRLIVKYLSIRGPFDVMLVGFPGQEIMFLARLLTRKPIVFDAFTSHYGGHILDRGTHSKKSLHARYYRFVDTGSCARADMVLLDTQAHIDFFVREFKVSASKFKRIFVGSDSDIFYPRPAAPHEDILVHFHGNYIPLQGVRYIIEAAKLLEGESIRLNLIGRGQTFKEDNDLAKSLQVKNINFMEKVPYEKLPELMAQADICLGIFGHTLKAGLVIPNKVFESLAMGKPLITADTPAIRELLKDQEHVILCEKANPRDLADKIRMLAASASLRETLGSAAVRLFQSQARESLLAKDLIDSIHERNLLS